MNADKITIEVKAKLSVDENTANTCLRLVELFVNETGRNILVDKKENGELSFRFEEVRV